MKELTTRIITGLVLATIGVVVVGYSEWTFYGLVLGLNGLLLYEFYGLMQPIMAYPRNRYIAVQLIRQLLGFSMMVIMIGVARGAMPVVALLVFLSALPLLLIVELFGGAKQPVQQFSINSSGLVYITCSLGLLVFVAHIGEAYTPTWIVGLFLLVIINDVFAYFVGRSIGRTKLMERISPKKTVEGFVGGGLFTLLGAWLLYNWLGLCSLTDWLVLGAIVWVFGTLGDLVVSMMKRSMSVKDTGTLLPGHGGFLDRFDALLMSLPFVAIYLFLIHA